MACPGSMLDAPASQDLRPRARWVYPPPHAARASAHISDCTPLLIARHVRCCGNDDPLQMTRKAAMLASLQRNPRGSTMA